MEKTAVWVRTSEKMDFILLGTSTLRGARRGKTAVLGMKTGVEW